MCCSFPSGANDHIVFCYTLAFANDANDNSGNVHGAFPSCYWNFVNLNAASFPAPTFFYVKKKVYP